MAAGKSQWPAQPNTGARRSVKYKNRHLLVEWDNQCMLFLSQTDVMITTLLTFAICALPAVPQSDSERSMVGNCADHVGGRRRYNHGHLAWVRVGFFPSL